MVKMKGFKAFVACTVAVITIMSATSNVMAATTGKVTADVLNLRSGKSLASSVIGKIPQNATVNILDSSDASWIRVSYNNKTGYVAKQYIQTATSATSSLGSGVVNADVLNVRKEGSTKAAIVAKLKQNQMVNVESKSGDWYYITSGSTKGYVSAEYITLKTLTGKVNATALNVRSAANLSSSRTGSLKQNASVEILSTSGEWYYVKSGSTKGYVFSEFVTVQGATVSSNNTASASTNKLTKGNIFKCTVASLNVRKSPSTSSARIGSLVKGNQVTFVAVASDKNWYQITTSKGVTGYVYKDYVSYYSTGDVSRGSSGTSSGGNTNTGTNTNVNASKADKIISTAKSLLGTKYVWGGTTTRGFDCSGFTQYCMKSNGQKISRTSSSQSKEGTAVTKANLQKGDLVFFSSSTGSSKIGHVGIYIGGGEFIHSSSGSKYCVIISSLSEPFYQKTYKAARRVL